MDVLWGGALRPAAMWNVSFKHANENKNYSYLRGPARTNTLAPLNSPLIWLCLLLPEQNNGEAVSCKTRSNSIDVLQILSWWNDFVFPLFMFFLNHQCSLPCQHSHTVWSSHFTAKNVYKIFIYEVEEKTINGFIYIVCFYIQPLWVNTMYNHSFNFNHCFSIRFRYRLWPF